MKNTMELHIRLEGKPAKIIQEMIEQGWASNYTEALRLALFDYMHHNPEIMKGIKTLEQVDSKK